MVISLTVMTDRKPRRRSPPVASRDVPTPVCRTRPRPRPRWCTGSWRGVAKVEVVGRSKEKVEEIFWEAVTQVRADLARIQAN